MTGPRPTVSAIITTYNRRHFLDEAVRGVLAQTWRDFELLVVDNYSDYDVGAFVSAFGDPRIRVFRNANHGVIAVNRRFAIERAQGAYLAFCDDDDVWEPRKLELQVAMMEGDPRLGLVYVLYQCFDDTGLLRPVYPKPKHRVRGSGTFPRLYMSSSIAHSGVMLRASVLAAVGLPNEDPVLTGLEDFDLWLRIAQRCAIDFVPDRVLLRYRLGATNWSNRSVTAKIRSINALLAKHRQAAGWPRYAYSLSRFVAYYLKERLRSAVPWA